MIDKRYGRRAFMALGTGAVAGLIGRRPQAFAAEPPKQPQPGAPRPEDFKLPAGAKMPMRPLGRTGVQVSLLGLGGYHIGLAQDEATAIRIIRTGVDHGVTFLDNCWDYNDGRSQVWMGRALRDGYRKRVFLMTKIDGRTRTAAAAQIDQCLRDLGTDVIDLMQIHEVIRPSDPKRVFDPGGAIEALEAARKAGKIRFVGFTGHKSPTIHLQMLATASLHHYRFDAVQLPVNVMDVHYESFTRRVVPELVKADIGVLGMKPLGAGVFLRSRAVAAHGLTPTDCLQYAMSQPTSVVITGCDTMGILMQGLDAALRWKATSAAGPEAAPSRTAAEAAQGEWEKYKTSQMFDGTAQHPWWLETASLEK